MASNADPRARPAPLPPRIALHERPERTEGNEPKPPDESSREDTDSSDALGASRLDRLPRPSAAPSARRHRLACLAPSPLARRASTISVWRLGISGAPTAAATAAASASYAFASSPPAAPARRSRHGPEPGPNKSRGTGEGSRSSHRDGSSPGRGRRRGVRVRVLVFVWFLVWFFWSSRVFAEEDASGPTTPATRPMASSASDEGGLRAEHCEGFRGRAVVERPRARRRRVVGEGGGEEDPLGVGGATVGRERPRRDVRTDARARVRGEEAERGEPSLGRERGGTREGGR